MHIIDWLVVVIPVLILLIIGIYTHSHMKSVAHFVSGGRVGGRYLLAVAKGEMQAGAVVFVALWEVFSHAGFVPTWWSWITVPVAIIVAIFGFVIYRFRETKAMTLAQFFEMRYSRNFRLFSGILGFLAGIVNFGIIPAIGARFMVYFLHFPVEVSIFSCVMPTYIPLMGLLLSISLMLTISGGLITLMVTDCVEGIFSQIMYIVLIVGVLSLFSWDEMISFIGERPPNHSLVNPFDAWDVNDFNLWFVLMGVFAGTYGTMAWQNSGSYNSAGATPHEARMGGLLGRWRESGKAAVVVLLALAALAFLHNPDFALASQEAREAIAGIEQVQIQKQMEIPVALSYLLPIGVKGALCAILLFGIFGGDSTHLHSWGGILAQDVILPRLKKQPTPQGHILLLRCSIIGVAIFAFIFGSLFRSTEYILMWWQVTMAIYVGGAGAAIIGGLYWKKGTTAGAWCAMVSGAILSGGGILVYKIWGNNVFSTMINWVVTHLGFDALPVFSLNGAQIGFFSTLISIALYIGVSLLTCRQDFPLNKMLHRDELPSDEAGNPIIVRKKLTFARMIGIDKDFSTGDKWITGSLFFWSILWFGVMIIGSAWNLIGQAEWVSWIKPWTNSGWLGFWHITALGLPILITVITGIWFTWGGIHDIRALFRSLKNYKIDDTDNGTVKEHKPY